MKSLPHGIYEALLDEFLRDTLARHPEVRTVFGKIDLEEQPGLYAAFVAKVLEQALREEADPEKRLALGNWILGRVADEPGRGHLENIASLTSQSRFSWKSLPPITAQPLSPAAYSPRQRAVSLPARPGTATGP